MFSTCNACWELMQYCSMSNCLFRQINLKSWENIWICCDQILEYLIFEEYSRKVNKTFASDMFRVFLFSSHTKLNWLVHKNLCSGDFFFFTLVSRTFRTLDFLQCSQCWFCPASVPHMDCIHTADGVCVWTWCKRPISHTAHDIRLVPCVRYCATIERLSKQKCRAWLNI